jgi:hypothetical protein
MRGADLLLFELSTGKPKQRTHTFRLREGGVEPTTYFSLLSSWAAAAEQMPKHKINLGDEKPGFAKLEQAPDWHGAAARVERPSVGLVLVEMRYIAAACFERFEKKLCNPTPFGNLRLTFVWIAESGVSS